MAFKSKDGKREFSMSSRKRAYDMGHGNEQADVLAPPGAEGEEPDEQDGNAVAEAHGPAQEVHMTHDDEMGSHHVHSVHPDGHEHHSDHPGRKEAHKHAAEVAGAGEGEPDEEEAMQSAGSDEEDY